MAWISENWKQDSSVFYGYPIPVSALVPEFPDISGFTHPWVFDELFYGYPHHENSLFKADEPDLSFFANRWTFDDLFYGYPHVFIFPVTASCPIFTEFSVYGIGTDFRQMHQSKEITLPAQLCFQFHIKEHLKL